MQPCPLSGEDGRGSHNASSLELHHLAGELRLDASPCNAAPPSRSDSLTGRSFLYRATPSTTIVCSSTHVRRRSASSAIDQPRRRAPQKPPSQSCSRVAQTPLHCPDPPRFRRSPIPHAQQSPLSRDAIKSSDRAAAHRHSAA